MDHVYKETTLASEYRTLGSTKAVSYRTGGSRKGGKDIVVSKQLGHGPVNAQEGELSTWDRDGCQRRIRI